MNEEEKKAIEYWKDYMSILHWNTQLTSEHYMKILLDLIEKQQKENEQLHKFILEGITTENSPFQNYQLDFLMENFIPIWRIEKLIKELGQDDINMTKKYKEKKNITGELLGIDKVRVRAYREKTREIKEKLQKLLIETKGE